MTNTTAKLDRNIQGSLEHCVTRIAIHVRFSDMDAMGIVHHSRLFDYFEWAREEYMRRRGVDLKSILQSGHNVPLSEAHIRFQKPVRFGDQLLVEIRLVRLTKVRLRFEYQLFHSASDHILANHTLEEAIASGWTEHVYTNQDLVLRRLPRQLLEQLVKSDAVDGVILDSP
jgi:acyl-CoA thioester hydrolase